MPNLDTLTAPEPLWKPAQMAAYLGVNRRTIYRWIRSGWLPGYKVGGGWRISRVILEEWAQRHAEIKRKGNTL